MNRSFWRKIIYLTAMAALLFPLAWLSQPDSPAIGAVAGSPGGVLSQMRSKSGLSQANLGQIDPTSETIKLATLGMRGVAANILWKKATDFQRTEDWTSLSATLEQISKLQPNFISVWRYQAWNQSYNVSVEFDDYRQRYHWVLKGVDFLRQGMRYNDQEPVLLWDVGWVLGHKIGTADEKKQYRILFRRDDDYHGARPMARRDNWLVGKEALVEAQQIVDHPPRGVPVPVKGTSEVLFHSGPAKWQTNYGAALEEDGQLIELKDRWDSRPQFGEVARLAFDTAVKEWNEFGSQREVVTGSGFRIRLDDLDGFEKELADLTKRLQELEPGMKEKLIEEKKAKLTEDERKALDTPAAERTETQSATAGAAEGKLTVSNTEIAERMPADKQVEGKKLAEQVDQLQHKVRSSKTTRDIIQYVYWKTRCLAERTPDALKARELMYQGKQAYLNDIDLEKARALYEECFTHWRKVLDEFPLLLNDRVIGDDLVGPTYLPGGIRYYEQVLKKLDEKFPKDFILNDIIERTNPDPPIGK